MRHPTANEVPIPVLRLVIKLSEQKLAGIDIDLLKIPPRLPISRNVAFNPRLPRPTRDRITSNLRPDGIVEPLSLRTGLGGNVRFRAQRSTSFSAKARTPDWKITNLSSVYRPSMSKVRSMTRSANTRVTVLAHVRLSSERANTLNGMGINWKREGVPL